MYVANSTSTNRLKCSSIPPGAGEFDSAPASLIAAFPHSCAVHHQPTGQFTLRALRAHLNDAMVQPDW